MYVIKNWCDGKKIKKLITLSESNQGRPEADSPTARQTGRRPPCFLCLLDTIIVPASVLRCRRCSQRTREHQRERAAPCPWQPKSAAVLRAHGSDAGLPHPHVRVSATPHPTGSLHQSWWMFVGIHPSSTPNWVFLVVPTPQLSIMMLVNELSAQDPATYTRSLMA